jgi:hypothetical protein
MYLLYWHLTQQLDRLSGSKLIPKFSARQLARLTSAPISTLQRLLAFSSQKPTEIYPAKQLDP